LLGVSCIDFLAGGRGVFVINKYCFALIIICH